MSERRRVPSYVFRKAEDEGTRPLLHHCPEENFRANDVSVCTFLESRAKENRGVVNQLQSLSQSDIHHWKFVLYRLLPIFTCVSPLGLACVTQNCTPKAW